MLVSAKVLCHYDPDKELVLACDASFTGLGVILSHRCEDGTERPMAYASRSLSKAECNYSQIEKGLSIVFGLKKLNTYLYGRHFLLVTDYHPS